MKKTTLLLALMSIGMGILSSHAQLQQKFDVKNILASSPEAAMLGRFGDIPISYYTGTADVSVPFYTIKEGGLEIPIVLRYHGGGNRVEDEATNVGLGWSLEPGGAIIQVINGKLDEDDQLANADGYNFLKNTDPAYPAITTPLTPRYVTRVPFGPGLFSSRCMAGNPNEDQYPALFDLTTGMGQPDIYQYSFPGGHSGKFYVNPENGNIVILDKKEDISFTREGYTGWVARTIDGNAFYFETMEKSWLMWDLSAPVAQTFKLTKIVVHNGKEINFSYTDAAYVSAQYSESFHTVMSTLIPDDYNDQIHVNSQNWIIHYVKTLTGITGDNTLVTFNLGSRDDIPGNGTGDPLVQKVNSVDIKNAVTGAVVKSFVFSYDYFASGGPGGSYAYALPAGSPPNAATKRLKLLSVQEKGYDASGQPVTKPPYQFGYDETVPFPEKSSFARDFWGYYNGQQNPHLLPDLTFFYYSDDNTYASNMPADLLTRYVGGNRSPDSTKSKVGLLKRITYPTGGFTTFGYEPNMFGNHSYPDIQKLQNANRLVNVEDQNNGTETKSMNFTLPSAQAITFNLEFSRQSSSTSFYDMIGSSITLSKTVAGTTSIVKQWNMVDYQDQYNNNNGDVNISGSAASVYIPYDPAAVYTLSVELQDNLGPQNSIANNCIVRAGFHYLDLPADFRNSYGGGMRVSSIESYTAEGAIASRKLVKYINTDNSSSGILMSPLRALWYQVMYSLSIIPGGEGNNGLADMRLVWNISSESSVPFSDGAQGNVVGYSRVEEVEVTPDNATKGKHVYNYYNMANQWDYNLPDDPNLMNGLISTDEIYNTTSTVPLQKTTYTYSSLANTAFSGFKTSPSYLGSNDVPCDIYSGYGFAGYWNNGISVHYLDYAHSMYINIYPIHGAWYLPSSKLVEKTENGVTMSTTENYAYNAKGQLIRTDTWDSKQQKRSTLSLFPIDNPGDAMSAQLITKGLYNALQQQTLLVNDNTELARTYNYYRLENGQAVQDHVTRTYKGVTYTEVSFDKYFNYKQPYQFTQQGFPTTMLWSFNYSKPIAEIKNATWSAVESVLGASAITTFAANANPSPSDINTFLAPLRSAASLSGAQIISYTYKPLMGMASQTDLRGQTTTYEYDGLSRLLRIRDNDNKILKQYDYQYQVQPGNWTPNWQVTGNYRCVTGTGGYNTGHQEQEQKDNNPGSNSYNSTRWIDLGVNTGACPITANWQATGNYRCQTGTGGYATGHQEQEQKDLNPYSSTYNTTRWADIGNTGVCPVTANWQATGNYRCQTGTGGYATGHQEQEQRDLNPYSGSYNTTRWVDLGLNTGACPINPNWQATGNLRCAKDGSNQNTGMQQREERDNNPYSSTYNTTRWVNNGNNYSACPLPYVFAKVTYENQSFGYNSYADIVVHFYADPAGTIPVSVHNLTLNLESTETNYPCGIVTGGSTPYVCNGSVMTLLYSAITDEQRYMSDGNYCDVVHGYFPDSGSGYQIIY